jgi:hypothetical protein
MDGSSCGFDRARSRSAKIIKGVIKTAYYPKARCSSKCLARRLAWPFFLPAASPYHVALVAAHQAKAIVVRAEAEAACPGEG